SYTLTTVTACFLQDSAGVSVSGRLTNLLPARADLSGQSYGHLSGRLNSLIRLRYIILIYDNEVKHSLHIIIHAFDDRLRHPVLVGGIGDRMIVETVALISEFDERSGIIQLP